MSDFKWSIGDYIKVESKFNTFDGLIMECFSITDYTGRFRSVIDKELNTMFISPRNSSLKLAGCFRVTKEDNPEYFL